MRVLIIDDSRATRTMLRRIMEEVGFEVTEAAHGEEGLYVLKDSDPFDLMLVDWNMPQMDGLEFVKRVRSAPEFASVCIMMITTENTIDRVTNALAAGVNEYVMKPFTKDVIREKLTVLGIEPT